MRLSNQISSLHSEDLRGRYMPIRSDYPVALLTRRTFSLESDEIMRNRRISPVAIPMARAMSRPY